MVAGGGRVLQSRQARASDGLEPLEFSFILVQIIFVLVVNLMLRN